MTLLTEFDRLKIQLNNLSPRYMKYNPKLYTNLFRCTDALMRLLKDKSGESDVDDWLNIIAEKLPEEMAEPRKEKRNSPLL